MPQNGLIFRALVASPGDCAVERKIISEVISLWNAVHSLDRAAIVEPVLWESHARPAMGDRPQQLINDQLLARCDLLIGAFWTRLGTPTGKAESGTAEEIEHFRSANKPVMLYFSSMPVAPDSLDPEQYRALVDYRTNLQRAGLYSQYDSHAEFREQLDRHLGGAMVQLLSSIPRTENLEEPSPKPKSSREQQKAAIEQIRDSFAEFMRRLSAEWEAERDSEPLSTDDGKYILSRAQGDVLHFRTMFVTDNSGVSNTLDQALKDLRRVQRHEVYMDGGMSWNEFWREGDRIIAALGEVPDRLRDIAERYVREVQDAPDSMPS